MWPTRKCAGYFGAVRATDGAFLAWRCEDCFNAEATFQFLQALLGSDRRIKMFVIIDNARYHHDIMLRDWIEDARNDLISVYLLPYSPELNPIERIWKLTKWSSMHNRMFVDLRELSGRIDRQSRYGGTARRHLVDYAQSIKTLRIDELNRRSNVLTSIFH